MIHECLFKFYFASIFTYINTLIYVTYLTFFFISIHSVSLFTMKSAAIDRVSLTILIYSQDLANPFLIST